MERYGTFDWYRKWTGGCDSLHFRHALPCRLSFQVLCSFAVGHVGEKWSFLELELRSRQGGKWSKVKATLCCAEYFCNFTASLAFYNNFHILITLLVAWLLNMPQTQIQALKRIKYENTWKCFGGSDVRADRILGNIGLGLFYLLKWKLCSKLRWSVEVRSHFFNRRAWTNLIK